MKYYSHLFTKIKSEESTTMQINNEQLMKGLRQSMEDFLYRFDQLVEKYEFQPTYNALRRQYADICSAGDVIINQILDGLLDADSQYYVKFLEESRENECAEFSKRLVDDYLIPTLDDLDENKLELFY